MEKEKRSVHITLFVRLLRRILRYLLRYLSPKGSTSLPDDSSKKPGEKQMRIAISSGHGLHVRGARGIIDEVDQARRVTDRVAQILKARGHQCVVFHDDVSRTVNDNLNAIINWHRAQERDRNVFVHFNAFQDPNAHGTEAIFRDTCDKPFVAGVAEAMSRVGFRLRPAQNGSTMQGAAQRSDLRVLNSLTDREEVLIEVCFVTSPRDVQIYAENFESLCGHIATALLA